MFKFTPEFLARNVRVALFWATGILVGKGYIESSYTEVIVGVVMSTVTWAWSLWGNRLIARINEIAGSDNLIVVAPDEVAQQAPSPSVVPASAVTVSGPSSVVTAAARENPGVNVVAR